MTPAQRKYDEDFIALLQLMSQRLASRSRKLADVLKIAAERLEALSASVPVDAAPAVDQHGIAIQPASTPDHNR